MADAADSKSAARECVRVRVPPPAPPLLFNFMVCSQGCDRDDCGGVKMMRGELVL